MWESDAPNLGPARWERPVGAGRLPYSVHAHQLKTPRVRLCVGGMTGGTPQQARGGQPSDRQRTARRGHLSARRRGETRSVWTALPAAAPPMKNCSSSSGGLGALPVPHPSRLSLCVCAVSDLAHVANAWGCGLPSHRTGRGREAGHPCAVLPMVLSVFAETQGCRTPPPRRQGRA